MIIDNNSNKTIHFSLNLSVIYGYCLLILIVYIFNLLLINNIYISCFIEVVSQAIVIYLADMYANHDIGTYALNTSENGFETGFVIFDADKKLIAYSKNVKEYFPEIKELSVGNKIKSVKGLAGQFLKWLNYFNIKTTNITDIVKTDEVSVRVYGFVKKIDRKKYYYFELSDYTVQQKLINIIGKDNKKLSGTTNHLFDPKLLDKINKDDKVTLENKEVSVSILSASLKDFNTIVNNTESDVMIEVLNKYLSLAEKIIHKYDGIIDRYSGYIISAFWIDSGDGDSAKQAAQASNEIIQESKNLKEEITKLISKELHFAIGLDYGKAILANIGTEKFNNYSLIGDSVNIVVKARNMASNNEIYLTDNVFKYLNDMELKKVDESTYQLVSLDKTNGGK